MLLYIPVLLVFICQEAVGLIIFPVVNRYLGAKDKKGVRQILTDILSYENNSTKY